ncbi:MAG: hypothetical protein AVDCRST_MAG06-1962, partial [uncultured Nocardioides sp.]
DDRPRPRPGAAVAPRSPGGAAARPRAPGAAAAAHGRRRGRRGDRAGRRAGPGGGVHALARPTARAGGDVALRLRPRPLRARGADGRPGARPHDPPGDARRPARAAGARRPGHPRRLARPPVAARRHRAAPVARPALRRPLRVAAHRGRGHRPRRRRDGPDGGPADRLRRGHRALRGPGAPRRARVGRHRAGVVAGELRDAGPADGRAGLPARRTGRHGRRRGLPGGQRPRPGAGVRAGPHRRRRPGPRRPPL